MTREDIARRIHWEKVLWLAGIFNILAMLPQLFDLLVTKQTAGLNITMFVIYMGLQIAFAINGFFRRDRTVMWSMGLAAIVSLTTVITILLLR